MRPRRSLRPVAVALGAVVMAASCAQTVTTVRTITADEYSANTWIGRSAEDVARAWGDVSHKDPDGTGGRVWVYRRVQTNLSAPMSLHGDTIANPSEDRSPNGTLPQGGATVDEIARFWLDADGRVYRFWFADEVYKKHLDAPGAKPVEVYGRKSGQR